MIRSFHDPETEALFRDEDVPRFRSIERVAGTESERDSARARVLLDLRSRRARRKLLYLNRARNLQDLRVPPGNRLEALRGDRKGQHSIRINDQWRLCFTWSDGEALRVAITDYH